MSASSAKSLPDLATLAKASGLSKDVFAYLQETGIVNSGVLYHMFVKRDNIAQHLSPLSMGVKVAGADVRLDAQELMIAQAVLEHMCDEVHLARAEQFASTAPAASVPSTSTATSSDVGKAPKTLPKNYWADMVADYQSVKTNGENRKFPAHLLLGAEEFWRGWFANTRLRRSSLQFANWRNHSSSQLHYNGPSKPLVEERGQARTCSVRGRRICSPTKVNPETWP